MANNEYSYNQLNSIFSSIENTLNLQEQTDGETHLKKFKRKLVFMLRSNMKKIKDAVEIIEEDLKDMPEGVKELQQKNIELMQEFGAKMEQTPTGGIEVKNFSEFSNNEEYKKRMKENNEEYADVLDEAEKVQEENAEIKRSRYANVKWEEIPLSLFPEDITARQMPLSFMEFVIDDEE